MTPHDVSKVSRWRLSAIAVWLVIACGPASTNPKVDTFDIRPTLAGAPVAFVLSQIDSIKGESVVTLDLACNSGHLVRTLRDTVVLSADGAARKGERVDIYVDDKLQSGSNSSRDGTWSTLVLVGNAYYQQGPSIQLDLRKSDGTIGSTPFRLGGTKQIMTQMATGGSCPGASIKSGYALLTYTRR